MIQFLWAKVHINAWRQKIKEMNDNKIDFIRFRYIRNYLVQIFTHIYFLQLNYMI